MDGKNNSHHKIEIVMPMAGKGLRFTSAGMLTPKPLLEVNKRPIFLWALDSVKELIDSARVTFIICKEDGIKSFVENHLPNETFDYQIIELENRTQGPAETLLKAKQNINQSLPLLSIDCDLNFSSKKYVQFIKRSFDLNAASIDGCLCSFESQSPSYSFVQIDENGLVRNIAEKSVISSQALSGAYYFSSSSDFFSGAEKLLKSANQEIYISHVIKDLLEAEKKFSIFPCESFVSFGTPVDFKKRSLDFSATV